MLLEIETIRIDNAHFVETWEANSVFLISYQISGRYQCAHGSNAMVSQSGIDFPWRSRFTRKSQVVCSSLESSRY